MNTNIYQTVTDRILKHLDAGVVPWRKTWKAGLPRNLASGKEYRGINILVLGTAEFTSCYWLTYRQALQLGGHVHRGERATPVVYWKWRTAEEIQKLQAKTGKEAIAPCFPFTSAVFNLDQVEGVPRPADDVPIQANNPSEAADQLIRAMPDKPEIVHGASQEPAYYRAFDRVALPHIGQFESAEEYYAALFHELAHSTGHPKRLNRRAEAEGDRAEKYSFEELVAEFAAAFLCAQVGISTSDKEARQADYIQGWAAVFRKDNRIIVRAASTAQRAADCIRGTPPPLQTEETADHPAPAAAELGTLGEPVPLSPLA